MENEECNSQQKAGTGYNIRRMMQQQKCLHEQDWQFVRWLSGLVAHWFALTTNAENWETFFE